MSPELVGIKMISNFGEKLDVNEEERSMECGMDNQAGKQQKIESQANPATGAKQEIFDPFKRRDSLPRSPPSRARKFSLPDLRPAKKVYVKGAGSDISRLKKEENLAFEALGKNVEIINKVVKDARNIHKQIRDAIIAATIYYHKMKDVRETMEKIHEEAVEVTNAKDDRLLHENTEQQVKRQHRETQTDYTYIRKEAESIAPPHGTKDEEEVGDSKNKKRLASTPPMTIGIKRRTGNRRKSVLCQQSTSDDVSEEESSENKEGKGETVETRRKNNKEEKDDHKDPNEAVLVEGKIKQPKKNADTEWKVVENRNNKTKTKEREKVERHTVQKKTNRTW